MSIITQEMRHKETTRKPITLKQFSARLKGEPLDRLPTRVLIDLDTVTREEFWSLIELMRIRPGGHQLIQRLVELGPSPSDHLKNLISIGKSSSAGKFIDSLEDVSDPNLILQKISLLLFDGRFLEALDLSFSLIEEPKLQLRERGLLMLFSGQALLEMGKIDQARIYLEAALDYSTQQGDVAGKFSSLLFLAKCAAWNGQSALSHSYLGKSVEILHRHSLNLRFYLDYYRCFAHVKTDSEAATQKSIAQVLLLTSRIAQYLSDPLSEGRGLVESGLICASSLNTAELSLVLQKIQKLHLPPHHDFDLWLDTFRGDAVREEKSYSLIRLCSRFRGVRNDTKFLDNLKEVESAEWFYDPAARFLIDLVTGKVEILIKDSPHEKLLTQLTQNNGVMGVEEVFEAVWKIKWHPGRHLSVLKMAISRFNRMKVGLKMTRREGLIELSQPGIILDSD
jgi:tetratricopeptide (TPR) repeat protein